MNFSELYKKLDQTQKTNEKVDLIVSFLEKNDDQEKIWLLALLTGRRPKKAANSRQLKEWAMEYTQTPEWLFDDCYDTVGDLSETIALLINKRSEYVSFSLRQLLATLSNLHTEEEQIKKQKIFEIWSQLDTHSILVFNKLIGGGFRIGVSSQLVVKALEKYTGIASNILTHRISGNWTPLEVSFQSLILEENSSEDLSKPYPFCLAYPLENEVDTLGNPQDWLAEWKWDGIRGQLVVRGSQVFLWSRGEELLTEKFPEISEAYFPQDLSFVIDGEIIGWKNEAPLPFQNLQTRIGRKNLSKKSLQEVPVVFLSYDILELNNQDLRSESLEIRRQKLESLVESLALESVKISEKIQFDTWEKLTQNRELSRDKGAEGLMLKFSKSEYLTGRKKGAWWKWKVEPYTIDAVMIYAQKGHGRRADLFTDYTFALWEKDKLVPFAKAYSGLTDLEIKEVDKFIKANTIEKFGPVRSVKPELVFELAFEDINISNRHKSGISVRFPRIKRWRLDKKAEDANTLNDLKMLKKI